MTTPSEVEPDDVADDEPNSAADAPPENPNVEPAPIATQQGQVFSACRETRVVGCDAVYVRMVKSAPDVCVQLVLDNCGENERQGLSVAVPLTWRLTSGSASTNRGCDVRQYDPKSQPALSATGKVSFAQRGRQISALEINVQLLVDAPPDSKLPAQIDVATPAPIADIDTCEL